MREPILRLSDLYALTDGNDIGIASLGNKNILLRKKRKWLMFFQRLKAPINVYYTYSEYFSDEIIKKVCHFIESILTKSTHNKIIKDIKKKDRNFFLSFFFRKFLRSLLHSQ